MPSKRRRIPLAGFATLSAIAAPLQFPAVAGGPVPYAVRTSHVLIEQGGSITVRSGSTEDFDRAKALQKGVEGLLYVREGGVAHVIRDRATLRQAEAIFEPQRRLGEQQAELGSRQAELGSRQAALGAEQFRLGLLQARSTPRQRDELMRQQNELGARQNALRTQQDVLGGQQNALGREQARLAREADAKFRALLADAFQRGLAQRVD
jgi:bla regulator protein blaR1